MWRPWWCWPWSVSWRREAARPPSCSGTGDTRVPRAGGPAVAGVRLRPTPRAGTARAMRPRTERDSRPAGVLRLPRGMRRRAATRRPEVGVRRLRAPARLRRGRDPPRATRPTRAGLLPPAARARRRGTGRIRPPEPGPTGARERARDVLLRPGAPPQGDRRGRSPSCARTARATPQAVPANGPDPAVPTRSPRVAGSRGYFASGPATLTEWIPGKAYGTTDQVFPAFGLTNNWPVVVPT